MRRPPHLKQFVRRLFPWLVVFSLAGCATSPAPVVPQAAPVAPMGAANPSPATPLPTPAPITPTQATSPVPAKPATVVGSEESSTLLDNFTAFVVAVDAQTVAAGRAGWNVPLPLPAGAHRLRVAFNRGVFAAEAEVPLNARPGGTYEVKFSSDAEFFGRNSYCEFWIVDTATGEAATNRVRAALVRRENSAAQ
ncbi:MAG TPA: hypothetical protein VG734_03010 [Lacunisphaera sp.]|nr:hypothetical protein [Lacunisphaera sp.]